MVKRIFSDWWVPSHSSTESFLPVMAIIEVFVIVSGFATAASLTWSQTSESQAALCFFVTFVFAIAFPMIYFHVLDKAEKKQRRWYEDHKELFQSYRLKNKR